MPRPKKHRRARAATLADVGRAAGVSAMAASAVLNSVKTSSRISEGTRQRILEAAARLQYRPNAAARALLHRRMHTIGIASVVDESDLNHYFLALFHGVLAAATHYEQNTTVFSIHDWKGDTRRFHSICDGRIDGLILLAPTMDVEVGANLPKHTPFVSIHSNSELPGVVNIESDEEKGAYELVGYLIKQGHRRIMHIAGPKGLTGAERRIAGYRAALKDGGLRFEKQLLVHSRFDANHGRAAMRDWLKRHAGGPLPHAVFCANDMIALGCIEALAECGLRVPDDISVAGFDDTLASRASVPQLTTVSQPLIEMGRLAVEILLRQIGTLKEGRVPSSPVVMPVKVVPRASVSRPPATGRRVPEAAGR